MDKSKIGYKDLINAALNKNIKITESTKQEQKTVYWRNKYTYISKLSNSIVGK